LHPHSSPNKPCKIDILPVIRSWEDAGDLAATWV
jgi:hypothetical protein